MKAFLTTSEDKYASIMLLLVSQLPALEDSDEVQVCDMEDLICTMHRELLDIKQAFQRGNAAKVQYEFIDMLSKGAVIYQRCILNGVFLKH